MSSAPSRLANVAAVAGFAALAAAAAVSVYRRSRTSARGAARRSGPLILFGGTSGGRAESYAYGLARAAKIETVKSANEVDIEELAAYSLVVLVISTCEGGTPPSNAAAFHQLTMDAAGDFRFGPGYLSGVRTAVIGFGDKAYRRHFCTPARQLAKAFKQLGAKQVPNVPSLTCCGEGDVDFTEFAADLHICHSRGARGGGVSMADDVSDVSDAEQGVDASDDGSAQEEDLEETGGSVMLSDRYRQGLEKEGYKLIGSHSAVKLCRWTKHQLRSRGGCYKHTMYGIESLQCMEHTPNMACANKCVFCWRSYKNPVGREWRWQMDEPEMIVENAISSHQKLIKTLRGVPGVTPEKFERALKVRHCALSLVGEPIMYPKINELLQLLHARKVSTFLVTNAQFPDQMRALGPCTQTYLSVDASTRDELKAVDRPLHEDFWERMLACCDELRTKTMTRTVFRLTLVKRHNMGEDAEGYARLVARARPDFVEIKSVTYHGNTRGNTLTMAHVPYHDEVVEYAQKIAEATQRTIPDKSDEYELACSHRHSCCVLLAKKKFKKAGKWHTWIDYDKFYELVESGRSFTADDYVAETPSWAVHGAPEEGFDPKETRVRNKGFYAPGKVAARAAAAAAAGSA